MKKDIVRGFKMTPKDKWNDIEVSETEKLRGALYDIERVINILKSIKDDISETRQRLERLEDKVDEEERRRLCDKWNSIKMMGER